MTVPVLIAVTLNRTVVPATNRAAVKAALHIHCTASSELNAVHRLMSAALMNPGKQPW
jgi:hypothetical protein